ncbi:MAG: hypothetical protein AB7V16_06925 [Vulcanibacillus sp.]
MNKKELILLSKTLNNILNSEKDSTLKFKYVLIKMNKAIKSEIITLTKFEEDINAVLKPFDTDKIAVYEKYGEPIENGFKLLPNNVSKANKELNELVEKYKDLFEENSKRWKEYSTLLEEAVDVSLSKIPLSLIPDWIEPKDLTILSNLDLIDESES